MGWNTRISAEISLDISDQQAEVSGSDCVQGFGGRSGA